MQPRLKLAAASGLAVALFGLAIGAGFVTGRASTDDRIRNLRAGFSNAQADLSRTRRERDTLKAERDRLEQQLASSKDPNACPDEYASTAASTLVAPFVIDYPCSWHVLEEPFNRPDASESERAGLMVDHLFLDPLPISKAPREGPLAQVELGSWYDDPEASGDALPPLAQWIAKLKSHYTKVAESAFSTASGVRVTRLTGTTEPFGDPVALVEYAWEYADPQGGRRIALVTAFAPPASVERALERLVRSFRLKGA